MTREDHLIKTAVMYALHSKTYEEWINNTNLTDNTDTQAMWQIAQESCAGIMEIYNQRQQDA